MRRAVAMTIAFAAAAAPARAAVDGAAGERPGRVLFEQAEAKFNVGRFDEALVDYQAAYDVEPLPAFLFNIGQCYRNLGNYERAQFYFRRYTALDPRSPNRPAAEHLIAEMDRLAAERAGASGTAPPPPGSPDVTTVSTPPTLPSAPVASAGDRSGTAPPAAFMAQPARPATAPARPVYRRAWFWVAASAVVVAGGVAAAFAVSRDAPRSSLRPIDTR
ncbi:MAG TPA: tetratricopeptide repeat protein [Polyangia bacterium]|jgi:tetratricopeptide (TPR) repeat protein